MIAATLFNQMAEARGLAVRAEARGIQIEPALQAATREGLSRDGFDVSQITPKSLQADDVQRAAAVITIGVANEPAFISKEKLQEWDDVPAVSKDYPAARDVMRAHIETPLTTLSTKK